MQQGIKDNLQRSKDASMIFITSIGISVLYILVLIYQSYTLQDYTGTEEELSTIEFADMLVLSSAVIQFAIFVISIIFFVRWFKRAYGNLIIKQLPTEYSENGSAWGFFIPIVSFYRPITTAKEIYLKTQYAIKKYNSNFKIDTDTSFIVLWWVFYWINNIFANYASKKIEYASDIDSFLDANGYLIISEVISIIGMLSAMYVIHKIAKVETLLKETNESVSEIDEIGKALI